MKSIEITTHVDTGNPLKPISKTQTVKFTKDKYGVSMELKSEDYFDTGDSKICLDKKDLINALIFLTEQ